MSRPQSFAPGSALLLLLLLAACTALCRGAPMAGELRCQCLQTEAAVIHPKRIAHVELIPEGPHCGVPEVIATTKHGKKVCLDPTAPWVKLIVTKIMNRYLPWGCRSPCCASGRCPAGAAPMPVVPCQGSVGSRLGPKQVSVLQGQGVRWATES
uniref:C-X-C motif chemokine n=1 Tax=Gopherus evgoodei TaxID=1825980 RepID=A0A8C4W6E5_9SAUR